MSHPIVTPPATIGMLGGGQLGKYAVMAASSMGYRTLVLDPDPSAPAGVVANDHLVAAFDDRAALDRIAFECDVVTTEFENPPSAALDRLAVTLLVAPSPASVAIAQDRIAEKRFLDDNGFPIGRYAILDRDEGNGDNIDPWLIDGRALVKTARLGYDGKGQRLVTGIAGMLAGWAELGGVPCVVEQWLQLDTEVSVLIARTADGRTATWPVAENRHVDGILDLTIVPADVEPEIADRAAGLALAIADALDYVGVLAVELFVVDGEVLVNELAPRPHNSGHWTLDACLTSQFEQQIRAVCGLGLGPTTMTADAAAMVNLLGDLWEGGEPRWEAVLEDRQAHLHLYGKSGARPGRKMGHLTVRSEVTTAAAARALKLRAALTR